MKSLWETKLGREYTQDNAMSVGEANRLLKKRLGKTRTELNHLFLGDIDRNISILEVGCNIGLQLAILQEMGFNNLHGIEINDDAIRLSNKNLDIVKGSVLDLPFNDAEFDLVFTSGVLIHINPQEIRQAMSEIHRCSRNYIWGYEYYARQCTEIVWRGHRNMLWKADFSRLYREQFDDLRFVREGRYRYLDNDNVDAMFLLRRRGGEK